MGEINIEKLEKSVFNKLYEIDTRERSVKKDTGRTTLNYLPWATTYSEACKHFDDVEYEFLRQKIEIEETETTVVNENTTTTKTRRYVKELPYFDTGRGFEVRTKVTINNQTKEMSLPVYDTSYKCMGEKEWEYTTKYGAKTVPIARFDDIYKSILRCFAKNLSMFGIGINLWTKEETSEIVLNIEKLQKECMVLIKKRTELSEEAGEKVAEICKELLPEENGDPTLCNELGKLEELKKKLRTIRK